MCPDVATDLVVEARKSVSLADMSTFKQTLDQKRYDLLIDLREPSEYATGHIFGAINIPRGLIEFMIWKYVGFPDATDMEKRIYVYCNSGGRASLSGKSLGELGFTNVTVVDMKLTDWVEGGHPIEIK
jgi:rhodanese-related sulfurtransferase